MTLNTITTHFRLLQIHNFASSSETHQDDSSHNLLLPYLACVKIGLIDRYIPSIIIIFFFYQSIPKPSPMRGLLLHLPMLLTMVIFVK